VFAPKEEKGKVMIVLQSEENSEATVLEPLTNTKEIIQNSENENQISKTPLVEEKTLNQSMQRPKNLTSTLIYNKPTLRSVKRTNTCDDTNSRTFSKKPWIKAKTFKRPYFQRKFYTNPMGNPRVQHRSKNGGTNQSGPKWVPKCEVFYNIDFQFKKGNKLPD